ncbi:MAG: aminotransferase class I/II-fold pyridoxal phosphate-dependent enzyme [Clostridia bacterium]|nr:aminotransferase class I/II-fold pyridoxal phosphate-dependent enzyme [Clostridia bacterium]
MIIDKLSGNKKIPMHMPGHKRNTALAPYLKRLGADLDITEIEGFDNLHSPNGIIYESMQKAAEVRGAKSAFYLVGGSTAGILASVAAGIERGDKVIVARNCHKSVYNALELQDAKPVFVMPKIHTKTGISGSIEPCDIEDAIKENPDAKLVILTSPTYEGVTSDIKGICKIAHKHNIPVLVDGAHGAHLGFTEDFLLDNIRQGADISVESLHKTLPSLTQTAVCYVNSNLVDSQKVADKLSVFQSSSPSYLLMASIDGCINLLAEKKEELFLAWNQHLEYFYEKCKDLENLKILENDGEFFGLDKTKIVILTKNGPWLSNSLREMGIECEMTTPWYVVAMTGMGDTKEMLSYFASCLLRLDKDAEKWDETDTLGLTLPEKAMETADAKKEEYEWVEVADSLDRISAGYVFAYPPGVPIIAPGEVISEEIKTLLSGYIKAGDGILQNIPENKVKVVK